LPKITSAPAGPMLPAPAPSTNRMSIKDIM
jgi:hypothetical protein